MLLQLNKEKSKLTASLMWSVLLLAVFLFLPNIAYAQPQGGNVQYPEPPGFENTLGLEDVEDTVNLETETDVRLWIVRLINAFLGLLGIILLVYMIYGGWVWMTSDGDADKINTAKKILKNALIGLLIILSAFAIVNFILRLLFNDVGIGSPRPPRDPWHGVPAIGDGIIESHYPERDQTDVPINTMIMVTFKEEIKADTICNVAGGTDDTICDGDTLISDNIYIYPSDSSGTDSYEGNRRTDDRVLVYSNDNKTFVFRPLDFLGSLGSPAWFAVKLMGGNPNIILPNRGIFKADGEPVEFSSFGDNYYKWKFETNGKLDLEPPRVVSVFPYPDRHQDDRAHGSPAVAATGSITVSSQPNVYQAASVGNPVPTTGSEQAVVFGDYICDWEGRFFVSADVTNNRVVVEGRINRPDLCDSGECKSSTNDGHDCSSNSNICYTLDNSGKVINGDPINDDQLASLGCGLSLRSQDSNFDEGNSWTISVSPEIQADTLTIGNTVYTFVDDNPGANEIRLEDTVYETNQSIINVINKNYLISARIHASIGNRMDITAVTAGQAGNSINLSTSNKDALVISAMSGGADAKPNIKVAGMPDVARNAVVQINFNEAVNPIFVSGSSDDVKDYLNINNGSTAKQIHGRFMISNNYRTVEFITNNACGMNTCGEEIYCLPGLENIIVKGNAASLIECTTNESCSPANGILSDYNICSGSTDDTATPPVITYGFCQKDIDGVKFNYPQADWSLFADNPEYMGIMDAASNSLDGDKNKNAEGPKAQSGKGAFSETSLFGHCDYGELPPDTSKVCTIENKEEVCGVNIKCKNAKSMGDLQSEFGDDYQWDFYTSDEIDLTSPIIRAAEGRDFSDKKDKLLVDGPGASVLGINQKKPIKIKFNKLMMSASIKPGRNYGKEDVYPETNVQREYFIMLNYSQRPLGYWCAKEDLDDDPRDGFAEKTTAIINHTEFNENSGYGSLAGSGVKDIYQNCYNPGADFGEGRSECDNSDPNNPSLSAGYSCCKGEASNGAEEVCKEFE